MLGRDDPEARARLLFTTEKPVWAVLRRALDHRTTWLRGGGNEDDMPPMFVTDADIEDIKAHFVSVGDDFWPVRLFGVALVPETPFAGPRAA